jgi:cytochrome c553
LSAGNGVGRNVNRGMVRGGLLPPLTFINKGVRILLRARTARPILILLAGVLLLDAASIAAADLEAGRRKAAACVACHGPDGNSPNPAVPTLAGQVATYLHWQLLLYRDRRRVDPQMAPIAGALSETDMADLAAFFAAQRPASSTTTPADAPQSDAGRRLAETYHCNDCHGRDFGGREYAPRLRGLSRDYVVAQMRGFKARTRGDLDGAMTQAAQPVADADIEPIADYIGSIR